MSLSFRSGQVLVSQTPVQLVNDSSLCNSVMVHADADNTGRITIGHTDSLHFETAAINASASVETNDGDITVTAAANGPTWNSKTIQFNLVDVAAASPNANYASNVININVNATTNTTLANINTAVHGLDDWDSAVANAGNFDPGDAGVNATTANGVDGVVSDAPISFANGSISVSSAATGAAWNSKTIVFSLGDAPVGSPNASYADSTVTVNVNGLSNTNLADINTVIHGLDGWNCSANEGEFNPGDAGIIGTTANGVTGVASSGSVNLANGDMTITAAATGTDWDSKSVVFNLVDVAVGSPNANYTSNIININVNATANTDLADINTAVHGLGDWDASANAGEFTPGDAGVNATTANGVTGASATASVNLANGAMTITSNETGATWNSKTVQFNLVDVAVGSPNANYTSNVVNINVNATANTNLADINTAVQGLTDWNASANEGEFDPGDAGVNATTANGVDAVNANAVLTVNDGGEFTVTAAVTGAAWNSKTIVFNETSVSNESPNANYVGSTITINVNDSVNTTIANIVSAVDALGDWGATVGTGGEYEPTVDTSVNATTANGVTGVNANAVLTFSDSGEITISAASTGTAYNGKSIVFALDEGTSANSPGAEYDSGIITITVNSTVNTTTANIAAVVNAWGDWDATEDTPGEFFPGDAGVTATTVNGVTEVNSNAVVTLGDSGEFTVIAAVAGATWNSKSLVFSLGEAPAETPNAAYSDNTITVNVNSTSNTTVANIVSAIDGLGDWGCSEDTAGEFNPGDAGVNTTTSGGVTEANANAVITLADAGEFTVTAAAAGATWNDKSIVFSAGDAPAATPNASYAADTITINVCSSANTTTANINTAVHGLDDWDCSEDTGGEFYPGDAGVTGTTVNGVTAVAANAVVTLGDSGEFTITAAATGTDWNDKTFAFSLDANTFVNSPSATYANDAVTLTINSTANTTTANVVNAVDALDDWGATEDTSGEFFPGDAGVTVTTSGGDTAYSRNGYELEATEEILIEIDALSKIYVCANSASQYISWMAFGG